MNTITKTNLFERVTFQGTSFNSRIVMAPMTRSRAIGSVPNKLMASYYAQRATAGLIITEGTAPSENGLGYARTPGIFTQEHIEGWKHVTDSVHRQGGKIFLQLMHVGRIAHKLNTPAGARVIAPSAIKAEGKMWTDTLGMVDYETPEEMTKHDIQETINEFVLGAQNAMQAGFDGIELHGANGYLLEQFLNPQVNQRNDTYGGSIENRSRFILELSRRIVGAIGKEHVGVRISPYNTFNDMPVYNEISETYSYLAAELSSLGVLYLHVVDGGVRKHDNRLIKTIRNNFNQLLILNSGYTKAKAEQAILEDGADLISFGSSFLANPDLPVRLKQGLPLNMPDVSTFYTADENGYIDYSFVSSDQSEIQN
jgi:N-ethylmaleimide reductase